MKKLILPLIFLPLTALAVDEMPSVSDTAIKNRMMTVVKDVEVEKMLGATKEFNDCRKENEFKADDQPTVKTDKLKKATDCFQKKITGKNADALKKLAGDLNLEGYGLIKSRETSDITAYLSKKMTKSLTGRDPDDRSAASLKWENQKIVDQKVFIDLYTNQLMKSALFEVSRYCFESLEQTGVDKTGKDFVGYWTGKYNMINDPKDPKTKIADITGISDTGASAFFLLDTKTDVSKKEDVIGDLKKGLSTSTINPDDFGAFFGFCQSAMTQLCANFKNNSAVKAANTNSHTGPTDNNLVKSVPGQTPVAGMSIGANSCLTMDKLRNIRTTMANTEKVAKQFEEMGEDKDKYAIQMLTAPQVYKRGKGNNEESLDEISSIGSTDMLQGADNKLSDLEQKCKGGAGGSECDDFLVHGDSLEKSIHNIESEMNLKREIEIARVKELKKGNDTKKLEEYLTENGLFDLLEKMKNPPANWNIEDDIAAIYDARKVAEIDALKLKVGKRQVTEKEYADLEKDGTKDDRIGENIKESKEERARLAQVVMFNNIITSQLDLTEKGSGKKVGRNVNAWKKEMKGLKDANAYDETLFSGVQDSADKNGSKLEDASVVGGGIIDSILGKKAD